MSSENAKAVAQEVVEKVRKGQKVVLGDIIKKRYSKSVSKSPTKVTKTKSYKAVLEPIVKRMENERDRIMAELTIKDLSEVDYEKLTKSLDIMTKNIQLLSGGETERNEVIVTIQDADKYKL